MEQLLHQYPIRTRIEYYLNEAEKKATLRKFKLVEEVESINVLKKYVAFRLRMGYLFYLHHIAIRTFEIKLREERDRTLTIGRGSIRLVLTKGQMKIIERDGNSSWRSKEEMSIHDIKRYIDFYAKVLKTEMVRIDNERFKTVKTIGWLQSYD